MKKDLIKELAKNDSLIQRVWQHYQTPRATPLSVTEVEHFWSRLNEVMGNTLTTKGGNNDNRTS